MNTALEELFKHNLWANLRLLDLCSEYNDEILNATTPGTYGKVGDTLHHLVSSEEGYLHRLNTGQPKPSEEPNEAFPGIEVLRKRARGSGEGLIQVAQRYQPGEVFEVEWEDGEVYGVPAYVYLIQAVNHATEHRSQVLTVLSQQGIAVPELSAWGYWDEVMSR